MPATTKKLIDRFMSSRRIAIVGVSSDPKAFSRAVYKEFAGRGYDVTPVNPKEFEVDGKYSVPRVQDIEPRPDAILVMTTYVASESVVRDCIDAGVGLIWFYRATGKGAVSPEAVKLTEEHDIDAIVGYCPLMFFNDAGFIHRLHGSIIKILGSYPK